MIKRILDKQSGGSLWGLILAVVFCSMTHVSSAEQISSGPRIVVSEADKVAELLVGSEVVFRDQATLRKLLNDLQIPLYYPIPALGINDKELQEASQLALLAADQIKSENKANKALGYDAGWKFRNTVSNWAWRIKALARTQSDVKKMVADARFDRKDGSVYINDDELAYAALLADANNPDVQAFKNQADKYKEKGDYDNAHAFYYAGAIGGDTQSLTELVTLLQVEQGVSITVYSGIRLLAALRPEGTLQVMRKFVREYQAHTIATKDKPREMLTWVGITIATTYLMAYGDDNDQRVLANLPLSENVLSLGLFWAATENAGDLFFEQFQSSWQGKTYRFDKYCGSFLYRTQAEIDSLIAYYIDLNLRAAYQPDEIDDSTYYWMRFHNEKMLSRCQAVNSVASDIWDAHDEYYSGDLTWVKQDGLVNKYLAILDKMKIEGARLDMIDYFDSEIMSATKDDTSLYLKLLRSYLALTENIHLVSSYEQTRVGRGEKRTVYRAVQTGNPDISLASMVTVLPRVQSGKLQIGLQLGANFAIGPTSGLSVMISGDDKRMQAYQENFGLSLIEQVVIEHKGEQTLLEFVRTTKGGTHIYELASKEMDSLQGLLSVQMKAFDDAWHLNFPLKYSQYALRHRLSSVVKE